MLYSLLNVCYEEGEVDGVPALVKVPHGAVRQNQNGFWQWDGGAKLWKAVKQAPGQLDLFGGGDEHHWTKEDEDKHPRDHGKFTSKGGGESGGGEEEEHSASHTIAKHISSQLRRRAFERTSRKEAEYHGLDPHHPALGWEDGTHGEHLDVYREKGEHGLGQHVLNKLNPENESEWGTISRLAKESLNDVDWDAVSEYAKNRLNGGEPRIKGNAPTKAIAAAIDSEVERGSDPNLYEDGEEEQGIKQFKQKLHNQFQNTDLLKKRFVREVNPNTAGENFDEDLWLGLAENAKSKIDPAVVGKRIAQTLKLPESAAHEAKTGRKGQEVVPWEQTQAYKDRKAS